MTYSEKQILIGRLKFFGSLGLLFIASFYFLWKAYSNSVGKLPIVITSLFYFLFGFAVYPLYIKMLKRFADAEDKILDGISHAKLGKEGEDMVSRKLNEIFDKNIYYIYSNYKIPHRHFDIDTVIIGPKGIIIFEIKNYSTPLIFDGDDAFLTAGKGPIRPEWDPRDEIRRHSYALLEYLKMGRFNEIQTHKAIVFPNKDSVKICYGARPGIYIIVGIDGLDEYVKNLPDNPRFTPEYCDKLDYYMLDK